MFAQIWCMWDCYANHYSKNKMCMTIFSPSLHSKTKFRYWLESIIRYRSQTYFTKIWFIFKENIKALTNYDLDWHSYGLDLYMWNMNFTKFSVNKYLSIFYLQSEFTIQICNKNVSAYFAAINEIQKILCRTSLYTF